jgi:hypothetical protein
MRSTLPPELQQAAERYLTTDVGYPKKADDAMRNPRVALLFSDPTGSGIADPPMVLVQGTARVDDSDPQANRERYEREMAAKLPALHALAPTGPLKRFFSWYYDRIYLHVRPERVYVWPQGRLDEEPRLYDAHVEEVRSGHNEEPETGPPEPEGGEAIWDPRLEGVDAALLACVGPDGFPFAARLPVTPDPEARVLRLPRVPVGMPVEPGPACLHDVAGARVFGDLVSRADGWGVIPYRVSA